MAIMPGAGRGQRFNGNTHKAKIDKLIVHTTEGSSWPGYQGGRIPPHFTARPGAFSTENVRQHIDTAKSAKALENRPGGVETNNDGCVQVELIGSCDRAYASKHGLFYWPAATDDDLGALVAILVWAHRTHGIPLSTGSLVFASDRAYGLNAPQRMTMAEWRAFSGVCGHQHVPENAHWDPGETPVKRAVELARRIVNAGGAAPGGGASKPAPAPAKPAPAKRPLLKVDGRWGRATSRDLQAWLGVREDGRAGADTWSALQREVGAPYVDGKISRQSHRATSLGNGLVPAAWGYTGPRSKGSQTIVLLQRLIGAAPDGVVGEGTVRALQVWLNRMDA